MTDDFDRIVRTALRDVADSTHDDTDLADRLIGNARAGREQITPLHTRRRGAKWALPLLTAAAVALVATGVVIGKAALSDDPKSQPGKSTQPTPTQPTPSAVTTAPQQVATPAGFRAANIFFRTATEGWSLGQAKCPTSAKVNCATLIHTANGGRSWSKLALPAGLVSPFVPDGSCGTNGGVSGKCVDQVSFADSSHGYLWSFNDFYATSDGGRHWTESPQPAHTTQLAFAAGRAVRLRSLHGCSAGCAARVESAPLGSATFSDTTPKGLTPEAFTSYLVQREGAVYLAYGPAADGAQTKGVLRSDDGGQHWSRVANDVCGKNSVIVRLVAGFDGSLAMDCSIGDTDRLLIAPPGSDSFGSPRTILFGKTLDPRLVAVLDVSTIVATDGMGMTDDPATMKVWISADGSKTYRKVATLFTNGDPEFVSATTGYVQTRQGRQIAITTDGGKTWRESAFS